MSSRLTGRLERPVVCSALSLYMYRRAPGGESRDPRHLISSPCRTVFLEWGAADPYPRQAEEGPEVRMSAFLWTGARRDLDRAPFKSFAAPVVVCLSVLATSVLAQPAMSELRKGPPDSPSQACSSVFGWRQTHRCRVHEDLT